MSKFFEIIDNKTGEEAKLYSVFIEIINDID